MYNFIALSHAGLKKREGVGSSRWSSFPAPDKLSLKSRLDKVTEEKPIRGYEPRQLNRTSISRGRVPVNSNSQKEGLFALDALLAVVKEETGADKAWFDLVKSLFTFVKWFKQPNLPLSAS